jgi:hypothetical protein
LRTLAYSIHDDGENNLSLALNSHVCVQITQRALGEDAVTGAAKDNRGIGQASATRYDFPDRSKQELRAREVLVIDVSDRNADDVGAEVLDGIPDTQHWVSFKHQVQQGHLVAGISSCGRHTGEP